MRSVLAGVLALGVLPAAQAADMPFDLPILRGSAGHELGPPRYQRWDGFYVGGQAGYSAASIDFGTSTSDLIAFILRNTTLENEAGVSNWTVLSGTGTSSTSVGGFVGYNMQWENAVIGLELNYDRTNLTATASDSIGRSVVTSDGYFNDVQVTSQASFKLRDYVTARLRGGWSAGWFMPYMFGAVALARVDVSRSATVNLTQTQPGFPTLGLNETREDAKTDALAYGYAAGIGVDIALLSNLFVRAEWEYLRLTYDVGTDASINTIRAGVGLKF